MGIIARRSTKPRKLTMYNSGFFTEISRRKYSMVNRMVNAHSRNKKKLPYCNRRDATLSSITIIILTRMDISKQISNAFPAEVLDSKITSCNLDRQLLVCKFISNCLPVTCFKISLPSNSSQQDQYRVPPATARRINPTINVNTAEPMTAQTIGKGLPSMLIVKNSGNPSLPESHMPMYAPIKPTMIDTRQPPKLYPAND